MGVFKNGVGRPSNETIKKRNILKGICLILLLIVITLVAYILNNTMKSNTNSSKTSKFEKLNASDYEQVEKLFNRMNGFTEHLELLTIDNDGTSELYDYFYDKESLLNKNVTDNVKFAIAYNELYRKKVNEEIIPSNNDNVFNNFRFYLEDINEKVNEIFGNSINVNNIINKENIVNVVIDGNGFKYDEKTKSFSLSGSGVGDCSSAEYKTKIIDAKKYSDKIEIINKVMFSFSSGCEDEEKLLILKSPYSYNNYKNFIIADLSNTKKNYNDINIDDYLDSLDSYKWTFTKNKDGNYIFSSVEKITTTAKQEKTEYFDKNRITTIQDKNDDIIKYLYVYDKKIDIGAAIIDVGKIETMKDIAIIELLTAPDPVLIIVNTNGDILYNTLSQDDGVYCTDKTNECKEFEIDNNEVYYYLENVGQDAYNVCEPFYNKEVLAKYEVTYDGKKISSPTKVSSIMTGKEYIQKHNVDCSR